MKPLALPKSLTLSPGEQRILASLSRREESSMQFWKTCYASRGIIFPSNKLPMATPEPFPGLYRLEWHSKALGREAIAHGVAFRHYQAKKDQEFAQKLQARGQGVW